MGVQITSFASLVNMKRFTRDDIFYIFANKKNLIMNRNQCDTCQFDYNCAIQEERKYKYDDTICNEYVPPVNNSRGMFRRLFTCKGRIRRLEFGLSYILFNVFYYLLIYTMMTVTGSKELPLISVIPILGLFILYWLQGIKRCHDLCKSGWWIIIPLFNPFGLLFLKGYEGINEYGTDPKQSYKSQVF